MDTQDRSSVSSSLPRPTRTNQVLRAEVQDVRTLASLLRPISFAAVGNFSVSEAGLQVTTEVDRSVQAVAYVSASIFSHYEFRADTISRASQPSESLPLDTPPPALDFDLNLLTLLECLNVFGGAVATGSSSWQQSKTASANGAPHSNGHNAGHAASGIHPLRDDSSKTAPATAMKLRWKGIGYPLVMLLEEQDVVTRCQLSTFESSYNLDLAYHHADTQAQAILSSEYLLDALQSIDPASCDKVTLLFSNTYVPSRDQRRPPSSARGKDPSDSSVPYDSMPTGTPVFKIISSSSTFVGATFEAELPNNSSSVLEKFSCSRETVHSYRYAHFSKMLRALQSSIRVSLRVSGAGQRDGLLSVQLMMPKGTGGEAAGAARDTAGHGFLEFLIAPLDEDLEMDGTEPDRSRSASRSESPALSV